MLACMDFRDRKIDDALARMEGADGAGGSDTLFWGIYAWIAYKGGQRDRALGILSKALAKHEGSESLKGMKKALANKKPVRMDAFAPGWYQFFPEDMPQASGCRQREEAWNRPISVAGATLPSSLLTRPGHTAEPSAAPRPPLPRQAVGAPMSPSSSISSPARMFLRKRRDAAIRACSTGVQRHDRRRLCAVCGHRRRLRVVHPF